MPRVYLVRHAENVANLTKEFSHRLVDYPLTDKGRLQAAQTAEYFRNRPIVAIYTSPLRRTRETAAIIGEAIGLEPIVIEQFREINVGTLEQQAPTPELWTYHNSVLEGWFRGTSDERFPDGETYSELWQRAQTGFRQLAMEQPEGEIVLVGHGGIFAMTIGALCPDMDRRIIFQAPNHNCAISQLDLSLRDGKPSGTFVAWADSMHLHGDAADFVPGSPPKEYFQTQESQPV